MTEASLALLLHPEHALSHLGSCGKPTLITTCRVIRHRAEDDATPDEHADADEIGQLIVRGPQVMWGYWNNPVETAESFATAGSIRATSSAATAKASSIFAAVSTT